MNRFLGTISFLLLLIVLVAFSPQYSYAAGEKYTWTNNGDITVSGGDLLKNGTLKVNAAAGSVNRFAGVLTLKHTWPDGNKEGCTMSVTIDAAADQKTGTIVAASGQQTAPRNFACLPDTVKKYQGAKVTIGGNPTCTVESDAQKAVKVIISESDEKKAPENLTIDIGGAKVNAKKGVEDGTAYYSGTFFIPEGDWKVCAPPLLECQTFKKYKCQPLNLFYGESDEDREIYVDLTVEYLALVGQSCKIGPYSIALVKDGARIKTIKTEEKELKETEQEKQAIGGTKDVQMFFKDNKFTNVDPGNYQVCIVGTDECKNVTRKYGNKADPYGLEFTIREEDTRKLCAPEGDDYSDEDPPPPPEPPCEDFNAQGECTYILTAVGPLSTDPGGFIIVFFAIVLSVSGGIAALIIIIAGYKIMTSAGKPQAIQEGRDQLVAAIVGLLFIIFSFVFLQVIGIDILQIPQDGSGAGGNGGGIQQQDGKVAGQACAVKGGGSSQGDCKQDLLCVAKTSGGNPMTGWTGICENPDQL